MEASQICNFLKHPNLLNESSLVDLKHIVERFPYFHTAWLLYLRNLKECEDPAFHTEKSRAAAFIPNRGKLLQYINFQPSVQLKTEFFKSSQLLDDSAFKRPTATTQEKQEPTSQTVKEAGPAANIQERIIDVITKVSPTPAAELPDTTSERSKMQVEEVLSAQNVTVEPSSDARQVMNLSNAEQQTASLIHQEAETHFVNSSADSEHLLETDFDNEDGQKAEDIHYNARNEYLEANKLENAFTGVESLEDLVIEESASTAANSNEQQAAEATQKTKKEPKDFRDFDNEHETHQPEDIHHGLRNEFLENNNLKQEYKAPHAFRDFDNGHEYEEAADIHYHARNHYLEQNTLEDTDTEPESLEELAEEEENLEASDIHYNWRNEYLDTNAHQIDDETKEEQTGSLLILEEENKPLDRPNNAQPDAADSLLARIQAMKKSKETSAAIVQAPDVKLSEEEATLPASTEDLFVLDSEESQTDAEIVPENKEVTATSSPSDLTNSIMEKIALIKAKKQQSQEGEGTENASQEIRSEAKEEKPKRDLIDQFIASGSRIARRIPMDSALAKEPQEDISVHSIKDSDDFITEGLAKVFTKQGYYEKAINAYQKLILKYPEKSSYFAEQIDSVQELINKQKK